jgi:hypothetical protein
MEAFASGDSDVALQRFRQGLFRFLTGSRVSSRCGGSRIASRRRRTPAVPGRCGDDERLEAALSARTRSELAALTVDLPQSGIQLQAKDLVRIDQRFGDVTHTGRWVVPRRMEIRLTAGDVKLDFTEAVITQDTLHIDVDLGIGGDLALVTRPGIVVDTDDLSGRLGDVKVRDVTDPNVPVILRVELAGRVRGGGGVARLPRRTLWQWLLRKPRLPRLMRRGPPSRDESIERCRR